MPNKKILNQFKMKSNKQIIFIFLWIERLKKTHHINFILMFTQYMRDIHTDYRSRDCTYWCFQQTSYWFEEFIDEFKTSSGTMLQQAWTLMHMLKSMAHSWHRLVKYISFRKRVNYFASISDNSGLIFVITTAWILSGRVVFLEWRLTASS